MNDGGYRPELSLGPGSVIPDWISALPWQQQSVLLLASRGPDGIDKWHRCKRIVRVYRGTVFKAAKKGRTLNDDPSCGEGDSFMDRRPLRMLDNDTSGAGESVPNWNDITKDFVECMDELPLHYFMHFMHGVEILGYKHPDPRERSLWHGFYLLIVNAMHLSPETEAAMDARLCDWNHVGWDQTRA